MSFWKEDLTAKEDRIEVKKRNLSNVLIKNLDERSHEIMECELDNVRAEVATRIYHKICQKDLNEKHFQWC